MWTVRHDGKLSERGTKLLRVWTGIVSSPRGCRTCIFDDFDRWSSDGSRNFVSLQYLVARTLDDAFHIWGWMFGALALPFYQDVKVR